MQEPELDEEERLELDLQLNEIYKRLKKLSKTYNNTMEGTKQLLQDLRQNECGAIALLIEQMQLNTLLQMNFAEELLLDKQNDLRPQDSEPLQCIYCNKKGFWH